MLGKVASMLVTLMTMARRHEAALQGRIDAAMRELRRRNATLPDEYGAVRTAFGQSMNLVDVVLTIVIAGVVGYVGLQVGSDTEDSAEFEQGSSFDNASNEVTSGFETSFGLLDVVFIALMLSVIVTALVGLRRR